jgi:hypothetical protein
MWSCFIRLCLSGWISIQDDAGLHLLYSISSMWLAYEFQRINPLLDVVKYTGE